MKQWHWYVYMIECENGRYYTGMTWDIDLRWKQHLSGNGSAYTKKYKPLKLVYVEEHDDLDTTRYRERQIKDWSQVKKRNLISGKWNKY